VLPKPYYLEKGITIYHGDCREILPYLPKVDLVLTDPPYGYNYKSNKQGFQGSQADWLGKAIANDDSTKLRDYVLTWHQGDWAVFGNIKTPHPIGFRGMVVWDKGPGVGMGDLSFPWKPSYEFIFIGGKGWKGDRTEGVIKNCWMVAQKSFGRVHPNEKPVPLLRQLLIKTPAKTILDPFMGSGTTLRAAKDLGLQAIGIELEEKYCEIAANRLRQEVLSFAE
jgi:DNA modification methylase